LRRVLFRSRSAFDATSARGRCEWGAHPARRGVCRRGGSARGRGRTVGRSRRCRTRPVRVGSDRAHPYSTPAETKPVTEQADLLSHRAYPPRRSAVDRLGGVPSLSGWGSERCLGITPRSVWAVTPSERWGIDFEVVVPVHLVAGVPGVPGIGGSRAAPPAGPRFAGGAASARALGRPFCARRPFCAGRSLRAGRGSAATACA